MKGFFLAAAALCCIATANVLFTSCDRNVLLTSGSANLYNIFLGCMFIVAMGVVMLQLVANPYVMVLGAPESGAFRMTLSQALNSVATTVAPIFITSIILGKETSQATPNDIPMPFLGLGIFTLILAIILFFLKLPNIDEGAQAEEFSGEQKQWKSSAFKYPHVWFGALGIFMYMGLEIGIPSMLPAYWKSAEAAGDPLPGSATAFLPFYWGGMMVGRFVGAAILSKFEPRRGQQLLFARHDWRVRHVGSRFIPQRNVASYFQPWPAGARSQHENCFRFD